MAQIPDYAAQFRAIYPHIDTPSDIAFTDISNAIAAFIAQEWRSDTAPFDALLRGEIAFEGAALDGLQLFYGSAGCATCHAGPFLTDHSFHAMGTPQIGPGKSATFEDHQRDDGRFRVTGRAEDAYAFRTPSLRNVAVTGPYGHAGAHQSLAAFIAHHADPVMGLQSYDPAQALLSAPTPDDFALMNSPEAVNAIASTVTTPPIGLSADDIAALVAFLGTLTDEVSLAGRLGIPETVPSGLAVP